MLSRLVLLAALSVVGLPVAARAADEKPHPIIAVVKKQVKDTTKPFTLVVLLKAKEGQEAKLEAAFVPAVKATRKEKGCVHYELNRDTQTAGRYLLYERWKSLQDLEAHLKSAPIKKLLEDLKEVTAGAPEARVMVPAGE